MVNYRGRIRNNLILTRIYLVLNGRCLGDDIFEVWCRMFMATAINFNDISADVYPLVLADVNFCLFAGSMVSGAVYQRQSQYPVNPLRAAPTTPPPTMRYYRLWIYTCNALLFISVLGFCIVAAKVLVFDPRRLLVPYLSLTQPSFLYAYAALIFQSGLLQLIGCLGAQRLNEKLLNVYWLLILVLLLGDVLLGVVWLFRFDRIATELKPWLEQSLARSYGVDAQFTTLWDAIQTQYRCCGANGHNDFPIFNHTLDAGNNFSSFLYSLVYRKSIYFKLLIKFYFLLQKNK